VETEEKIMESVKAPSAGIAFGVALLSLVVAGALFIQMQSVAGKVDRQLREYDFKLKRTDALLQALGLSLEPGSEYASLGLEGPPEKNLSEAQQALDQARVAAALGQLRNIQQSFMVRMAEGITARFPPTEAIRSYSDLRDLLSDYADIPADPTQKGWVFLSYFRPTPDRYLLVTEARNTQRTLITISQEGITPWY